MNKATKPLGGKCYGSIPHLPGSRLGPGDHHCHEGQAAVCTRRARDRHDLVIVQEKYDGSCVGVLRRGGEIIPLVRAGYPANTSPYEQHHLFWDWAHANRRRFLDALQDGERLCGEWLAQAHATRYQITTLFEPFVAFDIIRGRERLSFFDFTERIVSGYAYRGVDIPFSTPRILGYGPTPLDYAMRMSQEGNPWRVDDAEGAVYRVERRGKVDFLAKYVHPDKRDGVFLPEYSGREAVWNWHPTRPTHGLSKYP